MNTNRIIKFYYFILFFFLIKPDFFSYLGGLSLIYNLCFIICFAIVVFYIIIYIKQKRKISKLFILVMMVTVYPFIISIIQGVQINNAIMFPLMQTLGVAFLLEVGTHTKFEQCLSALALLLSIYIYI